MTRIDELRCTQCPHRVLANPASCHCYCHATGFTMVDGRPVHAFPTVPAPTSSLAADGGGRTTVAPPRPQTPTGSGGRAPGRGHHSFNPFWAMAAIVVMGTAWGAVHGWHVSWVDVAAGGFFTAVCVGFGIWYERGGE